MPGRCQAIPIDPAAGEGPLGEADSAVTLSKTKRLGPIGWLAIIWLALVALQRAFAGIDGVSGWSLHGSRDGTLDQARLEVGLDRPSLLDNPMWAARLADAVRSVTPVAIPVEARPGDDVVRGHEVVDRRPQHLGSDRGHPTGAAPTW